MRAEWRQKSKRVFQPFENAPHYLLRGIWWSPESIITLTFLANVAATTKRALLRKLLRATVHPSAVNFGLEALDPCATYPVSPNA